MEKIDQYRKLIQSLLTESAKVKPANLPDVENQLVFDETRDHYQLLRVGFGGWRRVYYCVFQLDINKDAVGNGFDGVRRCVILGVESITFCSFRALFRIYSFVKNIIMTAMKLKEEVHKLTPVERILFVQYILDTLREDSGEFELSEEWKEELDRRTASYLDGNAKVYSWETVRSKLLQQ